VNIEEIRKAIHQHIEAKGLRKTIQRDAIIRAAFSTKEHFTAEGLLEMARKIEPTVSRATVYRTLPLLVEAGTLREMDFGKDYKFYDPNFNERPTHAHLICQDCNKIFEFEDAHIDILENCISHRLGFTPMTKTLRIEGRCNTMAKDGRCDGRGDLALGTR
jgi:Fur family transcriptional regulator, ferric uptake regulator